MLTFQMLLCILPRISVEEHFFHYYEAMVRCWLSVALFSFRSAHEIQSSNNAFQKYFRSCSDQIHWFHQGMLLTKTNQLFPEYFQPCMYVSVHIFQGEISDISSKTTNTEVQVLSAAPVCVGCPTGTLPNYTGTKCGIVGALPSVSTDPIEDRLHFWHASLCCSAYQLRVILSSDSVFKVERNCDGIVWYDENYC